MSTKRKHTTLTLKVKNEIIESLGKGVSVNSLAEKYGVGRATVYDIKKNKLNIHKFISNVDTVPGNRKTLKCAENIELDKALYTWFLQERRRNTPISGPILSAKAKYFYEKLTGKTDFLASCGWLEGFKKRHGIRFLKTKGEKLSCDTTHVEEFKQKFLQKVIDLNLSPSQIYNADESGLQWRVLPNKTFVSAGESEAFGRKISKERVTFLPCSNASGQHSFVPEVRQWLKEHDLPQKALLVLDNAPSHPPAQELTSDDSLITVIFMPPNCTPILQPMDQCVIQCIKENYKKKLLFDAVAKDQGVEISLKNFNMKDMVFLLTYSWGLVKKSTIISSWKSLWPNIHSVLNSSESIEPEEDANELNISTIIEKVSDETEIQLDEIRAWYDGCQEHNIAAEYLSDADIVKLGNNEEEEEEEEEEEDNNLFTSSSSTNASEAIKSFDLCIQWAEEQGYPFSEILLLKRMQDKALKVKNKRLVQRKLDEYLLSTNN